jgi:transcriptional regulator with XRE-family HTH domain
MTLATTLGMCTHSYLSELEAGKKVPTASIILHVARTFGVSTDVLMKDELPLPEAKRNG